MIEPFGPMLGSQIVFGFARIAVRSLSWFMAGDCTISHVTLQSVRSFPTFNVNQVRRNACIRSVTACRYRVLETARTTVLSSAVPSVCVTGFRFENAPDDRAGASKFSVKKRPIPRFGPSDGSACYQNGLGVGAG
jgi:hypothetical protein